MRKVLLLMAVLALLCVGSAAQAAQIQGSTGWGVFGTPTTVNSHTFTLPQPTGGFSGIYVQTGQGDFSAVPLVFPTNVTWLASATLDVANPVGWTMGSAAFGTWVTTGGTHTHYNGGINVSLQGIFTPGTMFGDKTPSKAGMSLGFIMNGSTASNVSGTLSMTPPQLSLDAKPTSIYVKPNDTVTVDLNVANLIDPVVALQAMLNFSSTYFSTNSGDVNVVAGGGVWDQLIYSSWQTTGDLDVAVGVKLDGSSFVGTTADAKTAIITLKAKTEGITRLAFRSDSVPDEGLTRTTYLSAVNGDPILPAKVNSTNIYIDGTAPSMSVPSNLIRSTDAGKNFATVSLVAPTVTDAISGVNTVTNNHPSTAFTLGVNVVTWTATDKSGNISTVTQTVTVNDTEKPTITAPASVTVNTDSGKNYATGVVLGTPTTGDNVGVTSVTNDAPTQFPLGTTTVTWTVKDLAGNSATAIQTVRVEDHEKPIISIVSVQQGDDINSGIRDLSPNSDPNGPLYNYDALQSVDWNGSDVTITVSATDACLLTAAPILTVTAGTDVKTLTATGPDGGPWIYTYAVTAKSANGVAAIDATVTDDAGNSSTTSSSFHINKNTITCIVQLQMFVGTSIEQSGGQISVECGSGGVGSWGPFDNGVCNNFLRITAVSTENDKKVRATAPLYLARTLDVVYDADGQGVASFTGGNQLLGGDLNNSNSVNVSDYSILKANWLTTNIAADINGDGVVNTYDYNIMKLNWFKVGSLPLW